VSRLLRSFENFENVFTAYRAGAANYFAERYGSVMMSAPDNFRSYSLTMKYILALLFVLTIFTVSAFSQIEVLPAASPTPVQEDDSIVKITTNLIQIDVTVTDSKGNIVTDLKPEEIEISENGKKQSITNFSFVNQGNRTIEKQSIVKSDKNAPQIPTPPVQLRPDQVKRTFALVVDDLSLSFESVHFVRSALKKFVDEQMQPDDLVAIIRTGGGIGTMQQFTSDKRMLYAAIGKLKYNLSQGVTSFSPVTSPEGRRSAEPESDAEIDTLREDLFAVGTLGAVNYIIRGMKVFPGRKSIILISDGFSIEPRDGFQSRVLQSLKLLSDLANRSAVTVYTLHARGLVYTGLTASDDVAGLSSQDLNTFLGSKSQKLLDSQDGLRYLARATGGIAFKNNNDLNNGIQTFLNDQTGYYLIGYQPDGDTFDPVKRRFNDLSVKVSRKGLKVRYRSGFFGITDDSIKPAAKTPQQQILTALSSPFATGDIAVKLTPLFFRGPNNSSYVSSFIHINAASMKFIDEPDGWKKIVFDIMAVAFGDNGIVVDHLYRTETLRVRGEIYDTIMKDGFVYTAQFPIKKPGGYQMRIAVRDAETSKIGSANQFIEVPDAKKNRMILSGVVFQQMHQGKDAQLSNEDSATEVRQDTALRRFKQGTALSYSLSIYNPQIDGVSGQPKLKTKLNIYRDGTLVYSGKEADFQPLPGSDPKDHTFGGAFQLGKEMEPGDYVFQIVVTDLLAKQKNQIKAQSLDFEIVK
jgi:VWFA-related protein